MKKEKMNPGEVAAASVFYGIHYICMGIAYLIAFGFVYGVIKLVCMF